MVSGYLTFMNLLRVDGLSTDPRDLGRHIGGHAKYEGIFFKKDAKENTVLFSHLLSLKLFERKASLCNILFAIIHVYF